MDLSEELIFHSLDYTYLTKKDDTYYMREALKIAKRSMRSGDVPIGAVVVREGKIIGRGFNKVELKSSPFAHAEMIAMDQAAKKLGYKHLLDCDLYVTLEPCTMCSGAIVLARIKRLIIGAIDPKTGASISLYQVPQDPRLNHRIKVVSGVLADECSAIIKDFFKDLRAKKKYEK